MISAKKESGLQNQPGRNIFSCVFHIHFLLTSQSLTQTRGLGLHSALCTVLNRFPLLRLVEISIQFFSRLAVARYIKLDFGSMKRGGINLRDRFTVGPDSWGIFSCWSLMCLAQLKQPRGILFKTNTTRYPINNKLLPGAAGVQEMESFRCGMGGRPLSTNKGNGIINVGRSANSPPRYLIASREAHGVAPPGRIVPVDSTK